MIQTEMISSLEHRGMGVHTPELHSTGGGLSAHHPIPFEDIDWTATTDGAH